MWIAGHSEAYACIVRTRTHCTAIVPYSAIIEAIYACTKASIANNPFAFAWFGLRFLGGNTWQHQKSLYFKPFGSLSFRHLAGLLVGSRQDNKGTPHLCGLGRAGDSILNSHHIFRKKLPWIFLPHRWFMCIISRTVSHLFRDYVYAKKSPKKISEIIFWVVLSDNPYYLCYDLWFKQF